MQEEIAQRHTRAVPDLFVNRIMYAGAIVVAFDQPRLPKGLQVLRNRCLGQGQAVDDIAAQATPALRQELQDGNARRMPERMSIFGQM